MSLSKTSAKVLSRSLGLVASRRCITSSASAWNAAASTSSALGWTPSLPQGANPAYDDALTVLEEKISAIQARIDRLQSRLTETPEDPLVKQNKTSIEKAIRKSQVELNLLRPDLRWALKTGAWETSLDQMSPKEKSALWHLIEWNWKYQGRLDQLVSHGPLSLSSRIY